MKEIIPSYKDVKYGVVTFLDVLGWKGIWQRKPEAIEDLESIVNGINKIAKTKERGKTIHGTSVLIVSDTIVLFTEANYEIVKEIIELHGELCTYAIQVSIKKGLPLRGATSFGEVVISNKNNIFAGRAIDEAASWYEKADWIGVFLTPSSNLLFTNFPSKFWAEYKPPFKIKEASYEAFSVNWIKNENFDLFINEVKKDFTQLAPIVPEIVTKFYNTIYYLEHLKGKIKSH